MTAARPSSRLCALTVAVLTVPIALAGCGSSSKGGTTNAAKGCTPKADTKLVVLADDKHSQNSEIGRAHV